VAGLDLNRRVAAFGLGTDLYEDHHLILAIEELFRLRSPGFEGVDLIFDETLGRSSPAMGALKLRLDGEVRVSVAEDRILVPAGQSAIGPPNSLLVLV
jgi:hypothetical protein